MESLTPAYIATLLTVGGIRRRSGRSREAIYRAISRLQIKPILESPVRLYDPAIVETLAANMRQPNAEVAP